MLFYNKNLKTLATEMRKNMTPAEKTMWDLLRDTEFSRYRFLRQKPIGHFILDFYCQKLSLAIEVDGGIHYINNNKDKDKERSEILKDKYNIDVIRFSNEEILNNTKQVKLKILNHIDDRAPSPF